MTFQDEIDKTHPMNDECGENELAADELAMKLVGERHSKRDLVDLVRWLLLKTDKIDTSGEPANFWWKLRD